MLAMTFTAWAETDIISNDKPGENAILIEEGESIFEDIIVLKSGDVTDGGDEYDFYGYNAAILVSGDGSLTIESADISTDATYASAVFAYGGGITILDSKITTLKRNSGGIMVTGGGIITAQELNIRTYGDSSAAIRSDKEGGSINVEGGTYATSGQGSPAIYSTASITVMDATLSSDVAQGVVIEGGNTVSLDYVDMNANHSRLNGQDSTHQAVLIYQSNSGDAPNGRATFTMTDGSITNWEGDIFCVTNTTCTISLSGVRITNNDSAGNFLRAEGQNWGTNGGTVTLNASAQNMVGDVLVDSDSSLAMTLRNASTFTGAFNPGDYGAQVDTAAAAGTIRLTVEAGSKVYLTGDSYITSLTLANTDDIDYGDYILHIGDDAYDADNPYSGTDAQNNSNNNGNNNNNSNSENSQNHSIGKNDIVEIDISSLTQAFIDKVKTLVSNVEVVSLSQDCFTGPDRGTSSVDERFDGQDIVLPLPLIGEGEIPSDGIYIFDLTVALAREIPALIREDKIEASYRMYIHATKDPEAYLGSVSLSTVNHRATGMFVDSTGRELETAQELATSTSPVNVAIFLKDNSDAKYSLVITAAPDNGTLGPSGVGCQVGYAGVMALLACLTLITKRK